MKKKLQIFISSTYTDLVEERQAAVSAILKAGHIPAGMELFTSGDESQMDTIKRWIDESDVFMLILGGRYGSIEPNSSLSYTELEYDYAVKSGKPFFAVVIEESALEQKVKEQGRGVIEIDNAEKLKAFRKKVLSKISAFFKNVQDIKLAVFETIPEFQGRYNFTGWISGSEIPDIQTFTDQINNLRAENKRLTEDRNALDAGAVFTPSEEKEFEHIRQKLDRDVGLHYQLYQQKEGWKTAIEVGEEVYKVNLLSAIIHFVGKGKHRFSIHSIEYLLYERLVASHPLTETPEIKRGDEYDSVKENLVLELQTYGLDKFIDVDSRMPRHSTCEFTDKMYRFAYWLDYNGYVPNINFELVSRTVEPLSEAPPSEVQTTEDEIPSLHTIKGIDSALSFKARRNRWYTSEEGVVTAKQEFDRLCEELERLINSSNSKAEVFKIDFSKGQDSHCTASCMGVSLSITWSCKHPDTLAESVLLVKGNKTIFNMEGIQSFTEQDNLYNSEFDVDMHQDSKIKWKKRDNTSAYTTWGLANYLFTNLINDIHDRVITGK